MTANPSHKYVIVLGSCCTADAIRTRNFEDIRGAKLRLLSYQGRTSLLSLISGKLNPHEFTYTKERENVTGRDWGLSMVEDEVEKRHQSRLVEVIGMCDAIILDTVSSFVFPHLITQPNDRYFLRSKEWVRYITLRTNFEQKRLWE